KKIVAPNLDDSEPSYFVVRTKTSGEQQWIFLHFSPDTERHDKGLARKKMLYAATRASLTRDLGDSYFSASIFGSDKNTFTWDGYQKHLASLAGPKPLSAREIELEEIKEAEKVMRSSTERRSHAPGIAFPLSDRAIEALKKLIIATPPPAPAPAPAPAKPTRTVNFVTLGVVNESIDLVGESKISIRELAKTIDQVSPRFTFFAYEHTHDGTAHDSLVFIYTCPTASRIKERMVYSTGRAGVLQEAKDVVGLNVDKKLETTDVKELTEAFVLEELHPKPEPSAASKGFKKPARPTRGGVGVGARRVMF
ncbi:hypothetical protein B0O80DRAFT_381081, partial [Mortierella sp. GBAus27b]